MPVIKEVEKHAPDKEIGIMLPIDRTSYDLREAAHFRRRMKQQLLRDCQFPDKVQIGKSIIQRPENWR